MMVAKLESVVNNVSHKFSINETLDTTALFLSSGTNSSAEMQCGIVNINNTTMKSIKCSTRDDTQAYAGVEGTEQRAGKRVLYYGSSHSLYAGDTDQWLQTGVILMHAE